MALTTTVRARVDENLKHEAQEILAQMGMTTSQLITMTLTKLVAIKDIPFDTKIPTGKLPQATDEADNNIGTISEYSDFAEPSAG